MNQKRIFNEFNYDERKKLLPEEYEPLEFLPFVCHVPTYVQYIHVGWYKTEKDVRERIEELHKLDPLIKFSIDKHLETAVSYKYGFTCPNTIQRFLNQDEIVTIAVKKICYNKIDNYVYRQIGKDKFSKDDFVNDALTKGSLLLSTFEKFRKLESERCDIYEERNLVEIVDSANRKVNLDIQFDFDCLVLCAALSTFDNFKDKREWIKIKELNNFIDYLTSSLVNSGIEISEVLYGCCIYNNKTITKCNETLVKSIMDHPEEIWGRKLNDYIFLEVSNDIMMNKPDDFKHEKEFRIIFKLSKKLDQFLLKESVKLIDNGIIINDKTLTKYFEKLT